MSIGMAMLSAFILVCACSLFAGLIYGLIWILIDHPWYLAQPFSGCSGRALHGH